MTMTEAIPATTFDEALGIDESDVDRCPACRSRAVMPTLLARGEWECWEPSCFAVWTVGR